MHYKYILAVQWNTDMEEDIDIELNLRRAPLFCDISIATLHAISKVATIASYEAGELLFSAGDQANNLHVLIEGSVKLTARQLDGRESIIELLQPVDSFLMAAVLSSKPYLLSAEAITPVRVMLIPSELLRRFVSSDSHLALTMIASLANQYRQMVRHVKDLRLRTAAQRLGIYILQLVEKERSSVTTLTLPFVKKLIAARLNITPESMSRAIAALRQVGVDIQDDEVHIRDIEKLRRFCQVDNILDQLDEDLFVLSDR